MQDTRDLRIKKFNAWSNTDRTSSPDDRASDPKETIIDLEAPPRNNAGGENGGLRNYGSEDQSSILNV